MRGRTRRRHAAEQELEAHAGLGLGLSCAAYHVNLFPFIGKAKRTPCRGKRECEWRYVDAQRDERVRVQRRMRGLLKTRRLDLRGDAISEAPRTCISLAGHTTKVKQAQLLEGRATKFPAHEQQAIARYDDKPVRAGR